jgi:hypothetical protein
MSAQAEASADPSLRSAAEILWNGAPLGVTIERFLGAQPELEVIDQQLRFAPRALPISPPLSPERPLMMRCTGYRLGRMPLSRNLAFVDQSRLPFEIARDLRQRRLNLGQLFASGEATKSDFVYGTHTTAGSLCAFFRSIAPWPPSPFEGFVWRRYAATLGESPEVVVFEALPASTWEALATERVTKSRRPDPELAASGPYEAQSLAALGQLRL